MILEYRPEEVVEVGSGFSTLIARHAIRYGNTGSKLTVIDPEPHTNVSSAADEVILSYVEDSDLVKRSWNPRSILFIDSSHVCRSRGEPALFVLSGAAKPFPPGWLPTCTIFSCRTITRRTMTELCYTQQYLLHCLQSGSALSHHFVDIQSFSKSSGANAANIRRKAGSDPLFPGASYWIEVTSQ